MENKKSKNKILIIVVLIVGLAILLWFYGFTVVSIQQVEEMKIGEKFDPPHDGFFVILYHPFGY